ncbi:MAG: DUF2306 domain-containing protein [Terracidiphilus sp.]
MSTATVMGRRAPRKLGKPVLWTVLGLAFVSVLIFTDYPLLAQPSAYRTKLIHDHVLLIPHAFFALTALLIGPWQFSTRFRQKHLKVHRMMGRVYVISVFITAPIALVLGLDGFGKIEGFTNSVLASLWLLCTLCAFLTARNRQIAVHRQWMVRSYVFTLNFIFTRFLNPIPAYFHMSDDAFGVLLLFFSVLYLFFTDVGFSWKELTQKKA